jgi:UDP-N-acetylglucosamine 2-epimerase (non-hydrolysing)
MPEETNRVLADHCSDYLFAPTPKSREILLHEGIQENQIFMVGNTIVDAVHQNMKIAQSKTNILDQMSLDEFKFMLATSHRQENVDEKNRFAGIIKGLQMVQSEFGVPLIYPIHPRAQKQLDLFGIETDGLTLVEPLDYLAFLKLESKAKLILTDSGGVQEETCILGVPCITLRDNTERPETLEVGSNILSGTDPDKILEAAKVSYTKTKTWTNPFGDGKTGLKIINILRNELKVSRL